MRSRLLIALTDPFASMTPVVTRENAPLSHRMKLNVTIAAGVLITARLSPTDAVRLQSPGVRLSSRHSRTSLHSEGVTLTFNESEVISLESVSVQLMDKEARVLKERENLPELELRQNKILWVLLQWFPLWVIR